MALPGEKDLSFEAWVLQKLKGGMTVNSVARLFEGEGFETLKQENPDKIPIFLWFMEKYKGVDPEATYKKRVKKIDNIHSKFKRLNVGIMADVFRMSQEFTMRAKAGGEGEMWSSSQKKRDYLEGLDYDNIKFNTKFGSMTMEEMEKNVALKSKIRDFFDQLFSEMESDVTETVKDFQKRIHSILQSNPEGKEVLLYTQALNTYIKTFKNFIAIPNFAVEAIGAKNLLIMESGGNRAGLFKSSLPYANRDELNDEEIALIEQDNTPSV